MHSWSILPTVGLTLAHEVRRAPCEHFLDRVEVDFAIAAVYRVANRLFRDWFAAHQFLLLLLDQLIKFLRHGAEPQRVSPLKGGRGKVLRATLRV